MSGINLDSAASLSLSLLDVNRFHAILPRGREPPAGSYTRARCARECSSSHVDTTAYVTCQRTYTRARDLPPCIMRAATWRGSALREMCLVCRRRAVSDVIPLARNVLDIVSARRSSTIGTSCWKIFRKLVISFSLSLSLSLSLGRNPTDSPEGVVDFLRL